MSTTTYWHWNTQYFVLENGQISPYHELRRYAPFKWKVDTVEISIFNIQIYASNGQGWGRTNCKAFRRRQNFKNQTAAPTSMPRLHPSSTKMHSRVHHQNSLQVAKMPLLVILKLHFLPERNTKPHIQKL